jgi:hypothetical protein
MAGLCSFSHSTVNPSSFTLAILFSKELDWISMRERPLGYLGEVDIEFSKHTHVMELHTAVTLMKAILSGALYDTATTGFMIHMAASDAHRAVQFS